MTAPHHSPQKSAFPGRPYPQEPHQQPNQPVHPPVAPGQHLRPWPVNPEQQQNPYPEQPYRPSGQADQPSGRHAAEEELRRARGQQPGAPGQSPAPAPPIFVRKKRFEALAWTALVLGIASIVSGVAGALVGAPIVMLKYLTIGLAAVGVLLAVIALLGTRKVLAGFGAVLCAGAIAVATTGQVVASPESETTLGGDDAAAQDVSVRGCTVVNEGGTARAEATLEISNRTNQRQSYNITITVNDQSGPRLGEIHAISTAVEPGQTMVVSGPQASGNVTGRAQPGPADCRVADVNRLALGG
ncbi:hypothetical protein [Pseudonocardia adelaidensis]|uniref:MmpS family membrane protein n=1 Tax=Pseudonocardia adelaidensis TaxID=648754 RepID=A0ABP9P3H5_9PSEU